MINVRQIPPYDSNRGRNCTYYRVETPPSPGDPPQRRNDQQGEDDTRRVVLQEIPEPQGLPRFTEYHGPVITLQWRITTTPLKKRCYDINPVFYIHSWLPPRLLNGNRCLWHRRGTRKLSQPPKKGTLKNTAIPSHTIRSFESRAPFLLYWHHDQIFKIIFNLDYDILYANDFVLFISVTHMRDARSVHFSSPPLHTTQAHQNRQTQQETTTATAVSFLILRFKTESQVISG